MNSFPILANDCRDAASDARADWESNRPAEAVENDSVFPVLAKQSRKTKIQNILGTEFTLTPNMIPLDLEL